MLLYPPAILGVCVLLALGSNGAVVRLGKTEIVGADLPDLNQEFFGAIPFAEPPLGPLRFKPPVPKFSLDVTSLNATTWGPSCIQPESTSVPFPKSEDCLQLNIYRPAGTTSKSKLPVLVWVYGGGFMAGSAQQYSDGSSIVSRSILRGTPIIYVNLNYRLGPLGFPQGQEAATKGALSLGLKDQFTAIEWVHLNIAAFGGDPSKVTLFGESAGSISISVHFLNPKLASLARAAIFHSGTAGVDQFFPQRRQNIWSDFVRFVPECSSLATDPSADTFDCLRTVSSETVLNAWQKQMSVANEQYPWQAAIDGPGGILPNHPSILFKEGKFVRLPFIAGTVLDEGTIFSSGTVNNSETIRQWMITNHTQSPADVPALNKFATGILKLYPNDPALGSPFNTGNETFGLPVGSQYKRLSAIMGDILFQAPRRYWIKTATNFGVKGFGYLFTNQPPAILNAQAFGVFHSTDLYYVYPHFVPGVELSPAATGLSEKMLDYWISFVTTLDPNDGKGSNRPKWQQYLPNAQQLLQLNENLTMIPDTYRKDQIEYINSHALLLSH